MGGDSPISTGSKARSKCELCGAQVPEGGEASCDFCERILCAECVHRDVPDHHYTTCNACIEAMTPHASVIDKGDADLIEIAETKGSTDRDDAIQLIGKREIREGIPALITALKDGDKWERGYAARALGELEAGEAAADLVTAIEDPEDFVRYTAAEALGKIGDSIAFEPLLKALKDESEMVRGYAVRSLGRFGGERVVQAFEKLLRPKDGGWPQRDAVQVLKEIGTDEAMTLVYDSAEHPNKKVRYGVAYALARTEGDQAASILLNMLDDPYEAIRPEAAWGLYYRKPYRS
jgi:HEAT repeat protein